MVVAFVACYSCEFVSPRFGIERVITTLFSFSVFTTASSPYSGRECDDEKIKPPEHTRLCSVPLLVSEYLLVAPMTGAEEDVLTERYASERNVELVVVSIAFGFREEHHKQTNKVLRKAPKPQEYLFFHSSSLSYPQMNTSHSLTGGTVV